GDGERRRHDQQQAGVPGAEDVEKVQNLGRIGHAGDGDAGAEDETDGSSSQNAEHQKPPNRWRMTNTVIAVVAMKVAVATIDRGERRAMPQTPCPLVQPPPNMTPTPTSKPLRMMAQAGMS